MLSRRIALLGSTAVAAATAAASAVAQPARRPPPAKPGGSAGRKSKDPATTGAPAETPIGPVDTAAKWAYIQDFDTGATLLDKAADDEMPPSSMTKLMTIYLVYERLKKGQMRLEDELPVTEKAWRMGGSKMFVQIGATVKVEDLLRGVIVQSGNDACIVFAEAISGSEEQFADLMNAKAKEMGLAKSNFRNSTGWPDPEQRMSSRGKILQV
jgi:D-alanyl-D-alanine carboxypeptidase (penicillin-binding protein 5/6)